MHVKFISPKMDTGAVYSPLKFRLVPPQAPLLLAAITPARHTCELVDENIETCTLADTPDVVAITVSVDTASRAYQLADAYRRRGVPVVMGGLHVTACPEEASEHADAVVVGEADSLWPVVLQDLEEGNLKPVYTCQQRESLEHTPPTRIELAREQSYASVHCLRASRGCPHGCDFCYQSSFYTPPGFRHKPTGDIVSAIRTMHARHVFFLDDNLTADKAFAKGLFTALIPLGITWSGAATAGIGDDVELLKLARDSGCRSLFVGFETLGEDNIREHGKSQNQPRHYERQIAAMHRCGIVVNGSFIFGFDHDGPSVFADTVAWIVASGIDTASFHILTPYPGSPFFRELAAAGRIIDCNWDHYNTTRAVFQPMNMSPKDLEQGYLWARKEIYSWRNIYARAAKSGTSALPYWAFMLGVRKFAPITNLLCRLGLTNRLFQWGFGRFSRGNSR